MSNEANILDELGLTDASSETAVVETTASAATEEAAPVARAERTELKIVGEVAIATGLLPALERNGFGGGGKRGSKYPFEQLVEPTKNEAGEVTGYSNFTVRLDAVENADGKKLKGAIQAAVAQQNKQAKDSGAVERYVTRSVIENGEYVGSTVYRVDDTLAE